MKTLRLFFASLTFCFLLMGQSNAQRIINNTSCVFEVKANVLPTFACGLTGVGPLYMVPGGGTIIPVPLPGPAGSHWVPAYGVRRPGIPVKIPGDNVMCTYMPNYFVGFCGGAPAFASYIVGTQNLDIHF